MYIIFLCSVCPLFKPRAALLAALSTHPHSVHLKWHFILQQQWEVFISYVFPFILSMDWSERKWDRKVRAQGRSQSEECGNTFPNSHQIRKIWKKMILIVYKEDTYKDHCCHSVTSYRSGMLITLGWQIYDSYFFQLSFCIWWKKYPFSPKSLCDSNYRVLPR